MFLSSTRWKSQKHHLDRMTLPELVVSYFNYPAIQVYIFLAIISAVFAVLWMESLWTVVLLICLVPPFYALTWYLLHRFLLHGRFLYKSPKTAALWKRVHYDHHQDPCDLRVLFGALPTTLPPVILLTTSSGWLVGGPAGSATALTMGLLTTCFYEFCHCIQHLNYSPKFSFIRRMKKLHLAHHFHNEKGNYGITNFFWDKLFVTFYKSPEEVSRSETVFNLGYSENESEKYPWVTALSSSVAGKDIP